MGYCCYWPYILYFDNLNIWIRIIIHGFIFKNDVRFNELPNCQKFHFSYSFIFDRKNLNLTIFNSMISSYILLKLIINRVILRHNIVFYLSIKLSIFLYFIMALLCSILSFYMHYSLLYFLINLSSIRFSFFCVTRNIHYSKILLFCSRNIPIFHRFYQLRVIIHAQF